MAQQRGLATSHQNVSSIVQRDIDPNLLSQVVGTPAIIQRGELLGVTPTEQIVEHGYQQVSHQYAAPVGMQSITDVLPEYEVWSHVIVREYDPQHSVSSVLLGYHQTRHTKIRCIATNVNPTEAVSWRDTMPLATPITTSSVIEATMQEFACQLGVTREERVFAEAGSIQDQLVAKHKAVVDSLCRRMEGFARRQLQLYVPTVDLMLVGLASRQAPGGQMRPQEERRMARDIMSRRVFMAARSASNCIAQLVSDARSVFACMPEGEPANVVVVLPKSVFLNAVALRSETTEPVMAPIEIPNVVNIGTDSAYNVSSQLKGVALPLLNAYVYTWTAVQPGLDESPAWYNEATFAGFTRMLCRTDGNYVHKDERDLIVTDAYGRGHESQLSFFDALMHCGVFNPPRAGDEHPLLNTPETDVSGQAYADPDFSRVLGKAYNGTFTPYLLAETTSRVCNQIITNVRAVIQHRYSAEASAWFGNGGDFAQFQSAVRTLLLPPGAANPGNAPNAGEAGNDFYTKHYAGLSAADKYIIWVWSNAPMCAVVLRHQINNAIFPPIDLVVFNGTRRVRGECAFVGRALPGKTTAVVGYRFSVGGFFDRITNVGEAVDRVRYISTLGVIVNQATHGVQTPFFSGFFTQPPATRWMQPNAYHPDDTNNVAGTIFAQMAGIAGIGVPGLASETEYRYLDALYSDSPDAAVDGRELHQKLNDVSLRASHPDWAMMPMDFDASPNAARITARIMYSEELQYNRATGRLDRCNRIDDDVFGEAGSPKGLAAVLTAAPVNMMLS